MIVIDPGASGGIAFLHGNGVGAIKMPDTDREICDVFAPLIFEGVPTPLPPTAYLEGLVKFAGVNMPSSAMAAYAGNEAFIRGVLTAFNYKIVIVPPKAWQKALGLGGRKSHPSKTAWKNHLKQAAERLYPNIKVTLATADALLILEAAKRGLIG